MASQQSQCDKYKYILTPTGPAVVQVHEASAFEESACDYNAGGYLPIQPGDCFKDSRYHVLRKLGWGHFSTVWLVKDVVQNRHSALKVVKSAARYTETARDEIKLLTTVAEANREHEGRNHLCQFLDAFDHQGVGEEVHVCMVFEPLGETLLALIERNKKTNLPRNLVKVIAKQILLGLEYLADECDLVHTDIKPENILVSIAEVESHIGNQLSVSPPPSCRRVGIPAARSRTGLSIPTQRRGTAQRGRQVQIFDSQPLASPPPSRTNSFSTSLHSSSVISSLHYQISKIASNTGLKAQEQAAITSISSISSSPLSTLSSISSSPGSMFSHMSMSMMSTQDDRKSHLATPPTPVDTYDTSSQMLGLSIEERRAIDLSDALSSTMLFSRSITVATPISSVSTATALPDYKEVKRPASQVRITPPSSSSSLSSENIVIKPFAAPVPAKPSLLTQTAPKYMPSQPLCVTPTPPAAISASPTPIPTPRIYHPPPISIKIADLGNATPTKKHFTEEIQTRQYRAPEAIIGRKDWGPRVDVWSAACVIFELLTAEFLFDPQCERERFTKDDDHMAQIIELMGDFSLEAKMGGRHSTELFLETGDLRNIRSLKPWSLKRVMIEKYRYREKESIALCAFLEPMLACDPRDRADARDMVSHQWLEVSLDEQWLEEW